MQYDDTATRIVEQNFAEIKRRCKPLFEYIVGQSDYVQWVAYFTPLTFNLGQTTTNVVEIDGGVCSYRVWDERAVPCATDKRRVLKCIAASCHH